MKMIDRLLGFLRTLYLRKRLGGEVVATETVESDGVGIVYKITVENTGKVAAKYECGLHVHDKYTEKGYFFTSGWSNRVDVGKLVDVHVPVSLPEDSIPHNVGEAKYEVISILCAAG